MFQINGFGFSDSLPRCSQARVGQQCIPDDQSTIPYCSQARVGEQCMPDGSAHPPTSNPFTIGASVSSYTPPNTLYPPTPNPTPSNPFPLPGQSGSGGAAVVTGAVALPPTWTTMKFWTSPVGLLLLACLAFATYKLAYKKKPIQAAA